MKHIFHTRIEKYLTVKGIVGIVLFMLVFYSLPVISQTQDTLQTSPQSDQVPSSPDSVVKGTGIDSIVTYTANDSIVFTFGSKAMKLFGDGKVKYKDLSLTSERIDVNWNTNELESYGVLDSAKAAKTDTLKKRYRGTPVMKEGADKYEGWKISYNFKTQKGRVTLGETSQDQGYYTGQEIKKIDKNMLFIADGRYTTCEDGDPHYYFYSPEMRVTVRDKIVARPIYLYISDVPVFVLPFAVFPSQGGRRSGLIAPTFVDKGSRGTGLEHFGYYWAMSDYTDLSVRGDWLTGGTWRVAPNFRYAKRYDFTGSLSGYYQHTYENELGDINYVNRADFYANLTHNQSFNPSTRLDVNFTFASSENYRTALEQNDYLNNQEITSNATLSKRWEGTNSSMTLNINRRQNLVTGSITNTFPTISYSHAQTYPFRRKSSGTDYNWYEMIGMSYNAQYKRVDNKTRSNDTVAFSTYNRQGVNHSFSINASPKLGYFNISPSINYNEKWYDKSQIVTGVNDSTNNPIIEERKGLNAVRTFSMGLSASTKLYGMFAPPIPGIAGFRHTLTPTLSYTYTPDFSDSYWGYYQAYKDKNGKIKKFNKFQKEVYGGASQGESQALNLSVGNLFEMKTSAHDTTEKEQKYQLLNLNAGVGYNFAADSFQLSDLSIGYRTQLGQFLNISGNSTYRFYDYDRTANRRINKYLFESGKGIVAMTGFSLNLSTSFKGERKPAHTEQQINDSIRVAESERNKQFGGSSSFYDSDVPDFSIPWNLSLNFNYSQNQQNPAVITHNANLSGNLAFNLTQNWRFTASTSYDVFQHRLAAPQLTIFRDLHCWEMNFQWTPIGYAAGYRFEIRLKAPQLQDIKLTKQNNNRL